MYSSRLREKALIEVHPLLGYSCDMRRFLIPILLLALTAGALAAQQSDRQIFRLAEQRLQSGDYLLAARSYEDLIQNFPGSPYLPDAQARLGIALFSSGQPARALPQFQKVEARFRSSAYLPVMPLWLGLSHFEMGQFAEAEQALKRYTASFPWTDPGSADPDFLAQQIQGYRTLALSQRQLGKGGEAITTLEILLGQTFHPLLKDSVLELAAWYLQDRAYEEFEVLLDRIPQDAFSLDETRYLLFGRAESAFAREDFPRARDLFEEIRSTRDRFSGVAYQRLFQIAESRNDDTEQARIIRLAETDLAGSPDILVPFWLRVGQASYMDGQGPLAELYFLKIWEQRASILPPFETVLYLAQIEDDRKEHESARAYLLEYLSLHPQADARIFVRAADLSLTLGEPQRALDLLLGFNVDQGLQSPAGGDEIFSHAMYLRISSLYQLGRYDDAYGLIQSILGQSREGRYTAELLEYRGRIEFRRNQLEQAMGSFRQYLALRPDNTLIGSAYLRSLLMLKNYNLAQTEGERLLELLAPIEGNLREYERGSVEIVYQLALASLFLGEMQAAENQFARLPAGGGPSWYRALYPSILYYRGWTSYQRREDREAVRHFQAMLEVDTDHPHAQEAAYLSAWASFRLGDYSAAAGFFQGASLWVPDSGLADAAKFQLAKTFRAQKNDNPALTLLEEIWEGPASNPYRDDAQYERGQILADLGRYGEAARVFLELGERQPASEFAPLALYRRGEVLLEAGLFLEARQAFQSFRDSYPNHQWIDGALYAMGEASIGLGEAGAATLFWQRLANDYRNSLYRFEAMRRTGEILEQQGERARALAVYSELTARYPAESQALGLVQKVDQLALILTGLGEREASLWVEIENSRAGASAQGRAAILNLGQLLILDQTGSSVNRGNLIPLLTELAAMESVDAASASRASYLLAEWSLLSGNQDRAALYFLQAAESSPANDSQKVVYYYRSVEILRSRQRLEDARNVLSQMREKYPNHDLTQRAGELVEQGGSQ